MNLLFVLPCFALLFLEASLFEKEIKFCNCSVYYFYWYGRKSTPGCGRATPLTPAFFQSPFGDLPIPTLWSLLERRARGGES
jgi:hypothetical protein